MFVLNPNALPFQHPVNTDKHALKAMFVLNPNALPFNPVNYTDKHALFITFSNGFPLTETQIFRYFNRLYHPLVESVSVHKPRPGCGPSLFGKIVFKDHEIPSSLMGEKEKVHFVVEGRHFFCKKFVSNQNTKTAARASTSVADGGNHSGGDE